MERGQQGSMIKLVDITDFNLCKALESSKNIPSIITIAKKMMEESGKIPDKCPVPKNFKFNYKYIHFDPQFFPLLPASKFRITVTGYTIKSKVKHFCYNANITGQVVYNKKKYTIG